MNHLHEYLMIREDDFGSVEVCTTCKKKLVTKKESQTGKIKNKTYLEEHKRDFVQPNGKTDKEFRRVYGDPPEDLRVYKKK